MASLETIEHRLGRVEETQHSFSSEQKQMARDVQEIKEAMIRMASRPVCPHPGKCDDLEARHEKIESRQEAVEDDILEMKSSARGVWLTLSVLGTAAIAIAGLVLQIAEASGK